LRAHRSSHGYRLPQQRLDLLHLGRVLLYIGQRFHGVHPVVVVFVVVFVVVVVVMLEYFPNSFTIDVILERSRMPYCFPDKPSTVIN
jgi:hypothetical protein